MKKWVIFSISACFLNASNLLVVNDHADSAYFGQFEEIFNELGLSHDSWNVMTDGVPAIMDEVTHLIIYGNGTTIVPAVAENDDPAGLSDFLDGGGNLLLIDQNLFSSQGVASGTTLQAGDFAYDYLGVSAADTDHGIATLNSLIGLPFTFQDPLTMDFSLYHTASSPDFLTAGSGTLIYRTFPDIYWVGVHNEQGNFESIFLSFAADAIVKEDCGGAWYTDCMGLEFDNDDGIYAGYDCVIDDGNCCDVDGDGEIFDWLGDGYCDDGTYEFVFQCEEYSWDCDDCPDLTGPDPNGYCDRDNNYRIKDRIPAFDQVRDHANVTWDEKLGDLMVYLIGELEVPSAPYIHEITGPSGYVNNFDSQGVSVTATDFNGDSFSAQVEYAVNGNDMSPIIMSTANDTLFLGVVPGQDELGAEVTYKIVLTDDAGYSTQSETFSYEIFNITSDVLLVYNNSQSSVISEANYLTGSLDFDFWIGGVSDVQLPYYSTVFEIAPYWDGNYTDHLGLINDWLDEGNHNYFLAGDDVLYLIGLSGANLETSVADISTVTGNPAHSDLFAKMGMEIHFNDLLYIIDSVEYGYSNTPFELIPDEIDDISGAVFDEVSFNPLIYDPFVAFDGLYNYLDGIIATDDGTPIFYTGYNSSTDEGGFDQNVATGVHNEWDNGSKSVYLGFNPYALYKSVDDSLYTLGSHSSNPIKQAAEWFGLNLSIGNQLSVFPVLFRLENNFPNPFNPQTVITYSISAAQNVKLSIHDLLGREIALLVNEQMPDGEFTVTWNPENMPTGAYFARLQVNGLSQTIKMIYLK